jgi:hypothetical protein
MAEANQVFVAGRRPGEYFGVRPVDRAIPSVGFAGLRMDEGNLVLEPEQGPFAPVLAGGDFSQVMTATDLDDEKAWNTMALEEPVSDVIQFLRVTAA